MSTTILPFEIPSATPPAPNSTASTCGVSGTMTMIMSAFFGNLLARFADDAAAGNKFRSDRPDVVQKQPVPGGLQMARHRAAHDAKANESNIDHSIFLIRQVSMVCIECQPRPSTVEVLGLYSQPTQPR